MVAKFFWYERRVKSEQYDLLFLSYLFSFNFLFYQQQRQTAQNDKMRNIMT